jgi:hypothetical protein
MTMSFAVVRFCRTTKNVPLALTYFFSRLLMTLVLPSAEGNFSCTQIGDN